MDSPVRLTETVQKGGCAAKLPAGQLREVLGSLRMHKPEKLLVGTEHLDDACVWELADENLLIQTLDFFTPIVDDPFEFGQIAAANAMSDVYAMGGQPQIALSILAFPSATLSNVVLKQVIQGALERIHAAGACLAGGHTIDDDTLKFGLSVSGFVTKSKLWTNARSQVGDHLILTKGLGTGTLTSAFKRREIQEIDGAIASMKQLNRVPELIADINVHAATDITGFGLAGHALQMAQASGVHFEIDTAKLPTLPQAIECLEQRILNRAHRTNREYVENSVSFTQLSETLQNLCVDPQTSGGLLLSVSAGDSERIVEQLRPQFPMTAIIGKVGNSASNPRVTFA